MSELTLELLKQRTSWKFASAEVRLGRDTNCDVVFRSDEFPMVGRQHAVLRADSRGWFVEDLQSTNGTYVNQVRVQRHQLAPGDTLRLGSDGPELCVQFVDESAMQATRQGAFAAAAGVAVTQAGTTGSSAVPPAATSAELNATAAHVGTLVPATMTRGLPPTRTVVGATAPSLAPTKPSSGKYGSPVKADQAETLEPENSSAIAVQEQQEQISEPEDAMNEQRLNLLRNLVILMVGLVLVLGGIVISQMQQIADIRQNVVEMRADAKTAVAKFQPELDRRLTKMETNMDAMDGRIQKAEDAMDVRMQKSQDAFFARLDKELPKILDKYVEQKKTEVLSGVATGKPLR